MKTCSVPGCEKRHNAKGYCGTHYKRFVLYGDPLAYLQRTTTCSVEGCSKKKERHGFCQMHFWRIKHYGDIDHSPQKHCNVPDCTQPQLKKGYCNKHYQRLKNSGSLVDPIRVLDKKRYRQRQMPKHPLAARNGRVFIHRVVLYDHIGPGAHPCHWCGTTVYWERSYPKHLDALVVDHIDHDKHHNDKSNLVPSCNKCNVVRTRWGKKLVPFNSRQQNRLPK